MPKVGRAKGKEKKYRVLNPRNILGNIHILHIGEHLYYEGDPIEATEDISQESLDGLLADGFIEVRK